MTTSYHIPATENQFEFEIKRSQFICYADHASDRDTAEHFIRTIRAQHPQARHVCWAYIAGAPDSTIMSMSDDGEPSGTAGRPMLKILQHSGLGEIVVAVVRYYGGIKLGTGGLQRAYSDAVTGALENLSLKLKIHRVKVELRYDYAQESAVRYVLGRYDIEEQQPHFDTQILMTLQLATAQWDAFKTELTNYSAGAVKINLITAPSIAN
jgi:uncharacterized protein, YigZ family